ncbi:MAG: hypothetical protein JO141_25975 [Bradyrhizobium sp.]|nr:hypothetical protein [Methylobacteriaceae bacterium]MBV9460933.1 hypothetical protein [Bradyrhizobium sp.]
MTDAFDQFWRWRNKPPDSRLELPGELYGAVMSLPEAERSDREAVNEAARRDEEARRQGRVIWVYLSGDPERRPGDPGWARIFHSPDAARRWFAEHDPEGVAWGYTLEDARKTKSVWLYVNPHDDGDSDRLKPFAAKEAAEKWAEAHDEDGIICAYPVTE